MVQQRLTSSLRLALLTAIAAFSPAGAIQPASQEASVQERYDVVLAGGRVMDPESDRDEIAHVGIRGSEIAAISAEPLASDVVLDVSGLVVAPGFVDLHAHGQTNRANEFQARDGVTTALELESGVADPASFLARRGAGAILNYGTSVSHMSARVWAMPGRAQSLRRALATLATNPDAGGQALGRLGSAARYDAVDPADYPALDEALERGLGQGALGIGMAHQYFPGATREEVLHVFKFAADNQATIYTHVRSMGLGAVQEVVANAAVTGAALHVVHVNSSSLGAISPVLDLIGGARTRGIDVTTEAYPYTAASTELQSAIFDPGWQDRLGIGYGDIQVQDTGERLTEASFRRRRASGGTVIIHMMRPEWIRQAVARNFVMIASDGMPYAPGAHPRSAGTFSRFLGRYVRDDGVVSLMDGLERITLMPARRMEAVSDQMAAKGRLRVGADADIAVFDPERILDTATFEDDLSLSVGVVHVLVAGEFVVRDEENVEGALPGRAVTGRWQ